MKGKMTVTLPRTRWLLALVVALVAVAAVPTVSAARGDASAAELRSGFRKATGQKLVVDRVRSSAGRYTAFNLGVPTFTKQARYGVFTIYLVTGDVAANVQSLLTNLRTGDVEPPAPGGIHWEPGSSLGGGSVWTAKRLYAPNVVLWWTTTNSKRKTDRTYATLNHTLKGIVGR